MQIKSAAVSHTGLKREQNQDRFINSPELGVYGVADGMGGHLGGETAATLAVETIEEYFEKNPDRNGVSIELGLRRVSESIHRANSSIQAKGREQPALRGMGTTLSVLYFPVNTNSERGSNVILGQVGDSRTYLIQSGKIWQLSRDHSLVQEKLRAGIITRDQLKTDKNKNIITRSVGYEAQVESDLFWYEVQKGDTFVVCSDGLHGLIEDDDILKVIEELVHQKKDLMLAARTLIEHANANGGDDNVTAVIVHVE